MRNDEIRNIFMKLLIYLLLDIEFFIRFYIINNIYTLDMEKTQGL